MLNVLKFKKRRRFENIELPDDLITVSQFVNKYGCDKSYLYKLRDRGKLKLIKLGYYKFSEQEALEAMGV